MHMVGMDLVGRPCNVKNTHVLCSKIKIHIFLYIILLLCEVLLYLIIIITLLSNHRVEIHFALWRLHKNTVFK